MKSKKETVSIYLKKHKQRKHIKTLLSKKEYEKLLKCVEIVKKDNKKHFKKDRWDLSYHHLLDTVVNAYLGFDVGWFVMNELITNNTEFKFKEDEFVLCYRKK